MHTTAHPDDEHGGVLAMLSRGQGARVSLLTLTRGESGDNAIGPELFDALGLIRTEELLVADRYYGVDRQYFGTVIDYGFSKRLDEALEKWGKQHVLRDIVGVIRTERPLVLISRFQGNQRDGHGNHAAAGLLRRKRSRWQATRGVPPSRSRRASVRAAVEAVHVRLRGGARKMDDQGNPAILPIRGLVSVVCRRESFTVAEQRALQLAARPSCRTNVSIAGDAPAKETTSSKASTQPCRCVSGAAQVGTRGAPRGC